MVSCTGRVPTRLVFSCYFRQLHGDTQQPSEPVSQRGPKGWEAWCGWETLRPPETAGWDRKKSCAGTMTGEARWFRQWKKSWVETWSKTFLCLLGEFQLRLRQLEKSLLQALNEVKGRILDDDTIITTLENLKKEAAEVTRKVEETDIIMAEVEAVSQQYLSLSSACSSIYFTMESLNQVFNLLILLKQIN